MKKKTVLLCLIFIISFFAFTLKTFAETNNDVSIDERIFFVPEIAEPGPSMLLNGEDNFILNFVEMSYNENVQFKIEDENIAKITKVDFDSSSSTIKVSVKYLSVGKTKLTSTLDDNGKIYTDSYDLDVKPINISIGSKIKFYLDEPGPSMKLDTEEKYSVGLIEIPTSEKENIKFRVENESIAKIIKIEYDKDWADAIATVKYLSAGKTKLTATLDYNGETYTDSYEINVVESNNSESPKNPKTGIKDTFIILSLIGALSLIGYFESKNKSYLKQV